MNNALKEFYEYMKSEKPVDENSKFNEMFHQFSQDAMKVTMDLNTKYHTPDKL